MQFTKRHVIPSLLFLLAALIPINAQNTDKAKSEIEVRGTYNIPSGEAVFSSSGSTGTTIDFDRDFDLRKELGFGVKYTYRTPDGKHKFSGEYDQTTWNRNTLLTRSITFLGQTYTANLNLESDLRLSEFLGRYSYRWGNEQIRIGPMVDMGVVNTRLNLTGTTNSGQRSGTATINKFAATIGYDLDYDPSSRISIFHNLGAIRFKKDRLFHAEGGMKIWVNHYLGFSGGYRAQIYKLVDDDNFLKINNHGPFFGGVVRF